MGQIREQWKRMATEGGDWKTWIGIPKSPPATPPQPLTEKERQMLNTWFHDDYGRYPVSDYEFQQWLRDNW